MYYPYMYTPIWASFKKKFDKKKTMSFNPEMFFKINSKNKRF